jgi:hypothetical protein
LLRLRQSQRIEGSTAIMLDVDSLRVYALGSAVGSYQGRGGRAETEVRQMWASSEKR